MQRLLQSLVVVAVLAAGGAAWGQSSLPDPRLTPGALNPAVTQETVGDTICVRGWTRTVRPPASYTHALKRRQIQEWGYEDRRLSQYEEDHLVALGLGGSPYDEKNLWPEPRESADGWTAERKDDLEAALNRLVCAGRVSLVEAQQSMASNSIEAYRRFVGGG